MSTGTVKEEVAGADSCFDRVFFGRSGARSPFVRRLSHPVGKMRACRRMIGSEGRKAITDFHLYAIRGAQIGLKRDLAVK